MTRGPCANCGDSTNSLGWPDWSPIVAFEKLRAGVKQCICSGCMDRLRAAHAGPRPRERWEAGDYHIIHVNVDGAGGDYPTFARREDAIAYADWLQRRSDATGNPWLYSYLVYVRGREIHHSRIDPRVLDPPRPSTAARRALLLVRLAAGHRF